MSRWEVLLGAVVLAGMSCCGRSAAAPPPAEDPYNFLSGQIRGFVLSHLPDPLYEDVKKWGQQKKNARGKMKNDGRWMKVRITGRDLARSLYVRIEPGKKEPGRTLFNVHVSLDAGIQLDRQTWRMGLRLYSGSTRARVRIHLTLVCELTQRVEKAKAWLPDYVFRLRVVHSDFRHEHPIVEHTAGIGGDGARLLGELMLGVVKAAKPGLERDLAAKINAAVVKAGDTQEVRVSLADLVAGKKPVLPRKKPLKTPTPRK